jgi:hypothetical protein
VKHSQFRYALPLSTKASKEKGVGRRSRVKLWCIKEEVEGSNANRFKRRRIGRETPGVEEEDISIISTASRKGSTIR